MSKFRQFSAKNVKFRFHFNDIYRGKQPAMRTGKIIILSALAAAGIGFALWPSQGPKKKPARDQARISHPSPQRHRQPSPFKSSHPSKQPEKQTGQTTTAGNSRPTSASKSTTPINPPIKPPSPKKTDGGKDAEGPKTQPDQKQKPRSAPPRKETYHEELFRPDAENTAEEAVVEFNDEDSLVTPHYPPSSDDNSEICLEIYTPSGRYYATFPEGFLLNFAKSVIRYENQYKNSLTGFFPCPIPNVYFDVTDPLSGAPIGKELFLWPNRYAFLWYNGTEEFYVKKDGFLFPANAEGVQIGDFPIWEIWNNWDTAEQDLDSSSYHYTESISLVANPAIAFDIATHMGTPEFFVRLQESCEGGPLPFFLRMTTENIGGFFQQAFAQDHSVLMEP